MDHDHGSRRECNRCEAIANNGNRCRVRTCKVGPNCWIHTKSQDGLQVKPSTIPEAGLGLFTARPFRNNQIVDVYRGQDVSQYMEDHPNANLPYGICHGNQCTDAKRTNSCPSRYINDRRGTNRQYNVRFTNAFPVRVRTLRAIPAGR
jgi:photosystem II stability/assembly factor-like uncharacterized protein